MLKNTKKNRLTTTPDINLVNSKIFVKKKII